MRTVGQRLGTVARQRVSTQPKQADPHYGTPEHVAWRGKVLARAGYRCQRTGCGRTGVRLFADHIVELRDGGAEFDIANGEALCGSCHTAKTAKSRAARHHPPTS